MADYMYRTVTIAAGVMLGMIWYDLVKELAQ